MLYKLSPRKLRFEPGPGKSFVHAKLIFYYYFELKIKNYEKKIVLGRSKKITFAFYLQLF